MTFGYELRNLSGKEVSLVVSDPNMLAAQAEGDVVTVTVSKLSASLAAKAIKPSATLRISLALASVVLIFP